MSWLTRPVASVFQAIKSVRLTVGNATTDDFASVPNVQNPTIVYLAEDGPQSGLLIQARGLYAKFFNRTTDDSQQADSTGVFLADSGTAFTTTKPTVGNESDAVVQGANTAPNYVGRVIGHVAKVQAQDTASIDFAHGYDVTSTAARDDDTVIRQIAAYHAENPRAVGTGQIGAAWTLIGPDSIHSQDSLSIGAYTGTDGSLAADHALGATALTLETGQGAAGLRGTGFANGQIVQVDVGKNAEVCTITTRSDDTLNLAAPTTKAHSQHARVAGITSDGFAALSLSSGTIVSNANIQVPGMLPGTLTLRYTDGNGYARLPAQSTGSIPTPGAGVNLGNRADNRVIYVATDGRTRELSTHPTPIYASGLRYGAQQGLFGTSNAQGNNVMRASPFYLPRTQTFVKIGTEITSAGSAGALIRLGIYADNGNLLPGALVLDAGTIDGTVLATATPGEITISENLECGLYWLAAVLQGAPSTAPTVRTNTGAASIPVGGSTLIEAAASAGYSSNSAVSGALPGTFGTTTAVSSVTRVCVTPA